MMDSIKDEFGKSNAKELRDALDKGNKRPDLFSWPSEKDAMWILKRITGTEE